MHLIYKTEAFSDDIMQMIVVSTWLKRGSRVGSYQSLTPLTNVVLVYFWARQTNEEEEEAPG